MAWGVGVVVVAFFGMAIRAVAMGVHLKDELILKPVLALFFFLFFFFI